MGTRETKVKLTAQVQQYIEGMEQAARATRETGSEAEKLAKKKDYIEALGRAALLAGASAAAGVGLAVTKWADFDRAMSNVQAATHETTQNMELLSAAALDAGARTVFSAEEAANAIEELAKAGVSTADILGGGLDGALDLAAAGGLGVADAAGIAATALKTFNLEGKDMSHVADLLAAGAGKAMGDVSDLSQALAQGGMVASQVGLSLDETTAALAAFASKGMLGSDAGTSLKTMLLALNPASKEAAQLMDKLNLSAYDQQGRFIGLAEYAGKLDAALGSMSAQQQSAALKTLFGNDAYRAAAVLLEEGAAGVRKWESAVNDQGYAAEQAALRLDNLKGDIEALGGALDTALIKTGSAANDAMREMVQWVTGLAEAYAEMPPELQSMALWSGIVVAAVGVLGGGFLLAVPKVAAFKVALNELEITSNRTASAVASIAPAGIAVAAVPIAAALTRWIDDLRETVSNASDLEKQLRTTGVAASDLERGLTGGHVFRGLGVDTQIVTSNLRSLNTGLGQMKAWFDTTMLGEAMSLPFLGLGREAGKAQEQIRELDTAMAAMVQSGDTESAAEAYDYFADMAKEAGWSAEKIAESLPEYTEAMADSVPPAKTSAESAAEAAAGYTAQADAARAAANELFGLIDALMETNSVAQTAEGTNARYQQTLAAVAEHVANAQAGLDGYSTSLDAATVEGSKNREMLAGMASDSQAAASAILQQEMATLTSEQATANYTQRLAEGREALYNTILQLTGNAEAAQALTDKLYAMPTQKQIDIVANTAAAASQLESFIDRASGRTITVNVALNERIAGYNSRGGLTYADGGLIAYANGGIAEFAAGGFPTGIYSGGPPIHKFAEPETGWEAYISGKPSERDRNRQIWAETGQRLGVGVGGGPSHVEVSLAGAVLQAELEGQPVTLIVKRQIVDAFSAASAGALTSKYGARRA